MEHFLRSIALLFSASKIITRSLYILLIFFLHLISFMYREKHKSVFDGKAPNGFLEWRKNIRHWLRSSTSSRHNFLDRFSVSKNFFFLYMNAVILGEITVLEISVSLHLLMYIKTVRSFTSGTQKKDILFRIEKKYTSRFSFHLKTCWRKRLRRVYISP
jgi:hypothetical protein